MQNHRLSVLGALIVALFFSFSPKLTAQETCSDTKQTNLEVTPGCKPTSCRGQQTKFKEAKVISDLRDELVDLKSKIQKKKLALKGSSDSILIGETDEESLRLIFEEVQLLQDAVRENFNINLEKLEYSSNAAKTVRKLKTRIGELTNLL